MSLFAVRHGFEETLQPVDVRRVDLGEHANAGQAGPVIVVEACLPADAGDRDHPDARQAGQVRERSRSTPDAPSRRRGRHDFFGTAQLGNLPQRLKSAQEVRTQAAGWPPWGEAWGHSPRRLAGINAWQRR